MRLTFLKLTWFSRNKHKELIGGDALDLIGQQAVMVDRFILGETPLAHARLHNPVYKGDVLECFAAEDILAGESVTILEVDCGILKVGRTSN